MSDMEATTLEETKKMLETPQSARNELANVLTSSKNEGQIIEYLERVNDIICNTVRSWPYFLTEVLTCSSSWACGVILGWLCKNHLFTDVKPHELAVIRDKLFIPISLLLAFLFNEESRRFTENYQNWQTVISNVRNEILFGHEQDLNTDSKVYNIVATNAILLTALKMEGIRRAQERHHTANKFISLFKSFRPIKQTPLYTDAKHIGTLWRMNQQQPGMDGFNVMNRITCPTCPGPLYRLLWFMSLFLSATLVWEATNDLWDELAQSFGVLVVLYAPYVFTMAGSLRSYHIGAGNIFWKSYAGGLQRLIVSTWKLQKVNPEDVKPEEVESNSGARSAMETRLSSSHMSEMKPFLRRL